MGAQKMRVLMAMLAIGGSVAFTASGATKPAVPDATSGREHDLTSAVESLETQSYAAWKSGDAKFWVRVLSEKFVGWGPTGRMDKRAAVPVLSGASCRIERFSLTHNQLTPWTSNAVLLTHKTEVDGTCNGKPIAPAAYTATVYVRESGRWKMAYRAQSAIVDPMKATRPAGSDLWSSGPTRTDAGTQTLLAREQVMVDAWKDHDAARMDKFFGPYIQFVDIFGDHIGERAVALKAWSGEGCDVKSFEFTGAQATMFTPDFGVLTYRAAYVGKCFGQELWPIWGTAFYVKRGDHWMWSSGINVLAGAS